MATAADIALKLKEVIGENAEASTIKGWLDSGIPEANLMISQKYDLGAPQGRIMEIFGPASSGKTFLATQLMADIQKQGGIAFFADHERSFDPVFAKSLGMNPDPVFFKHLKPETLEESVDLMWRSALAVREAGLPMDVPCIFVIDSVAAAIPRSKLYDSDDKLRGVGSYKMNDHLSLAKACSQSYPILKKYAEDCNFTVLLLNQIRLKPGVMYGDPITTPGGNAAEFYADVRISLGKKDLPEGTGKDKEIVGFAISAKATKNKVARPLQKAHWQIRFNEHELGITIDQVATNVDYLIRLGLIEQKGNRVTWEGKNMYKSQLIALLKEDEKGNEKLMALLRENREDQFEYEE